MDINGRNFDIETCIHNIAMEYARRDLEQCISKGHVTMDGVTGHLDCMFDSYVQAFGYLSRKDSDYIRTLLEHA